MPAINIFGSSHVTENHRLPSVFTEAYGHMEVSFQNKFYLGTAKGVSGGKISNSQLTDNFVTIAANTAKKPDYDGQVVCLLLGTNDWASPEVTEEIFAGNYKKLVDRILEIPQTAVIITGLVPREESSAFPGKRSDMRIPTKIVRVMASSYQKENKMVRFVPVHEFVLEAGSGDRRERRNVKEGSLKDGTHMAKTTVEEVAGAILFAIQKMPRCWFPPNSDWFTSNNIEDI